LAMMKPSTFLAAVLLLIASTVSQVALALPELPFCPFGGPPGWANRIFNDRDDYYLPPPYYVNPYWQPYPVYSTGYGDSDPAEWPILPSRYGR